MNTLWTHRLIAIIANGRSYEFNVGTGELYTSFTFDRRHNNFRSLPKAIITLLKVKGFV